VKAYAPCLTPNGVSTTADGKTVYCADRKNPTAKPYSGGKLRWTPAL
jgi:sugar lactone lactonase YvrE